MFVLPKIVKKVIVSLLVFVFLFLNLSTPVKAESTWYAPTYSEWHNKVYSGNAKDIFGERYTSAQVWWIIYSIFSFILDNTASPDIMNCAFDSANLTNPASLTACLAKALASAPVSNTVATTTEQVQSKTLVSQIFQERPISAQAYFKDFGKNIKLVPDANAQTTGFGFKALNPILFLWKAVRDVSYLFFIIAIIVLSFMIMFRVKLNPQTAITVQSAIPKVVIALILVTFSYAIAGLLIDLMYVFIGLISLVAPSFFVAGGGGGTVSVGVFNFLTLGQPLGLNTSISVLGLFILYLGLFTIAFVISFMGTFGAITSALAGAGAIAAIVVVSGSGVGLIILVVLAVIVVIFLLVMVFKTIFTLIKAYANVLLLTIFAPFIITLGIIIPGMGFGKWFKDFVSNLAVFVAVGLLFLLAFIFLVVGFTSLDAIKSSGLANETTKLIFGTANTTLGVLSNEDQAWPPLLGGGITGTASLLMLGVSFVIFTIIPKTAQFVEALIKGQQFNYGSAINEATNPLGLRDLGKQVGMGEAGYRVGEFARKQAAKQGKYAGFFRAIESYAERNKFIGPKQS